MTKDTWMINSGSPPFRTPTLHVYRSKKTLAVRTSNTRLANYQAIIVPQMMSKGKQIHYTRGDS